MTFPGFSCNASGVYEGQKSHKTVLSGFFLPIHVVFSARKFQQVLSIEKKKKRQASFTDVTSYGSKLAAKPVPSAILSILPL